MIISDYSSIAQAITLLDAPKNFAGSDVGETSFDLIWDALENADTYQVDVSDDIDFSNIVFTDITSELTVSVTELDMDTDYYCRIRAYNDEYEVYGIYSDTLHILTALPIPDAPEALDATDIAETEFTANWEASTFATGYKLDVSEDSNFSTFVSGFEDLDVGNVLTYNVDGLDADTTYHYRIRAYNTAGESDNSDTIDVTTEVATTFDEDFADGNYDGWTVASGTFAVNNSVANPLNANQYSLVCNSSGYIHIANAQAYGRWEFDIYKGYDTNVASVGMKQAASAKYAGTGYEVVLAADELISLNARPYSLIARTLSSYFANNTWYRMRIDRDSSGVWSIYIKGGAFGSDFVLMSDAGGGSNPGTNNSYTTLAYFIIDIQVGDRISNIKMWDGLEV